MHEGWEVLPTLTKRPRILPDKDVSRSFGDLTRYISRREVRCPCGCRLDSIDHETVTHLDYERHHWGQPVIITSGFRCAKHNRSVGGKPMSQHLHGRAIDSVINGVTLEERYAYYQTRWPERYGIGIYPRDNMLHFDTRTDGPARWVQADEAFTL